MTRILAGQLLTPARLNDGPGWTTFTPSWTAATTNPSIGNGTLSGRWRYADREQETVEAFYLIRIGSTTALGSGQYRLGLPVQAPTGGPDPFGFGTVLTGSQLYNLHGWQNAASAPATFLQLYRMNVTTQEAAASFTGAAPAALAAGNTISMWTRYRAVW